jgi:hypothetical protein
MLAWTKALKIKDMSKYTLPVICNSANPSNLGVIVAMLSLAPQLPQNLTLDGLSNPHFSHFTKFYHLLLKK